MNQPHLNHAIIASMLIVVLALVARHPQQWSRFSTLCQNTLDHFAADVGQPVVAA